MTLYDTLAQAIRDHWKAHDNAYPQKIVLSTQQYADLMAVRAVAAKGNASGRAFETDSFLGVPLEIDDAGAWWIVGADGQVEALPKSAERATNY